MTVGNIYIATSMAGSCFVVTTDIPDDTAMVWRGRFHIITN
jgi:hypothetical protein